MLAELTSGKITPEGLRYTKQEALETMFGASRKTCNVARKAVLAIIQRHNS
jgi:hypothetical protein